MIYLMAFVNMIKTMIRDLFIVSFKGFFDDPARTVIFTVIISLSVYFKFYYPLDKTAPWGINLFLFTFVWLLVSILLGIILYLLYMAIYSFYLYVERKFMDSLEKQRKTEKVYPIETTSFFKNQMAIVVKKIKRRTPEKPNQRLDSVE